MFKRKMKMELFQMDLVDNELDCCHNSTSDKAASHMCFYVRDWAGPIPECMCCRFVLESCNS